jgi:hypothetical protein
VGAREGLNAYCAATVDLAIDVPISLHFVHMEGGLHQIRSPWANISDKSGPVSTARPRNDFRTVHYAHGPARSPCLPLAALSIPWLSRLHPTRGFSFSPLARCFHAEPYQGKPLSPPTSPHHLALLPPFRFGDWSRGFLLRSQGRRRGVPERRREGRLADAVVTSVAGIFPVIGNVAVFLLSNFVMLQYKDYGKDSSCCVHCLRC